MKDIIWPAITVVIPTKNEEKRIENCLKSIFRQDYTKSKLQLIVSDDSSTDKTLAIAKKFKVEILSHKSSDPEVGKRLAFDKAKGEFFMYLDADIHLKGKDWFKKMVYPLIERKDICASFTRYFVDSHSPSIEKYLTMDPLQRDIIYEFFSPSIKSTIIERNKFYELCKYNQDRIPPAGLCLHRKKLISPLLKNKTRFLELDLISSLVKEGNDKFAYVPEAGLFHHHAKSFLDLCKKRWRNATKVYLKNTESKTYKWFDVTSIRGLVKIISWVILVHLFFPLVLRGIYKSIRFKDLSGLYEPFIGIVITDLLIIAFLTDKRTLKLFTKEDVS